MSKSLKTQSYTKNYKPLRKVRKVTLPREEHVNWFPSDIWLTLKTYMLVTLYRLNSLYLGMYLYICNNTYAHITIDKKRGH